MSDLNDAPPIVLAAGLRTPWARAGGKLKREDAAGLAARVCREMFARTAVNPADLDEVIAGCVGPPHDQANVARVIALRAGVPEAIPARTVARNCASGIEAVTSAVTSICAGHGDAYLTLGVEVMSQYPLLFGPQIAGDRTCHFQVFFCNRINVINRNPGYPFWPLLDIVKCLPHNQR